MRSWRSWSLQLPRTPIVYPTGGSARLLREGDHLGGEHVLPALMIPMAELSV
jgi:hypothetical protein